MGQVQGLLVQEFRLAVAVLRLQDTAQRVQPKGIVRMPLAQRHARHLQRLAQRGLGILKPTLRVQNPGQLRQVPGCFGTGDPGARPPALHRLAQEPLSLDRPVLRLQRQGMLGHRHGPLLGGARGFGQHQQPLAQPEGRRQVTGLAGQRPRLLQALQVGVQPGCQRIVPRRVLPAQCGLGDQSLPVGKPCRLVRRKDVQGLHLGQDLGHRCQVARGQRRLCRGQPTQSHKPDRSRRRVQDCAQLALGACVFPRQVGQPPLGLFQGTVQPGKFTAQGLGLGRRGRAQLNKDRFASGPYCVTPHLQGSRTPGKPGLGLITCCRAVGLG